MPRNGRDRVKVKRGGRTNVDGTEKAMPKQTKTQKVSMTDEEVAASDAVNEAMNGEGFDDYDPDDAANAMLNRGRGRTTNVKTKSPKSNQSNQKSRTKRLDGIHKPKKDNIIETPPENVDKDKVLRDLKLISNRRNGRGAKSASTPAKPSTASQSINFEANIGQLSPAEVLGRHNKDVDEPWVADAPSASIPADQLPPTNEFRLWEPKVIKDLLKDQGYSEEEIEAKLEKINAMIAEFRQKYTGSYGFMSNAMHGGNKTGGESRHANETPANELEEAQRFRDKTFIDMEIEGDFAGQSDEQIAATKAEFFRHFGSTEHTDPKTGETVKESYAPLKGTRFPVANESFASLPPEAGWQNIAGYPLSSTSNRGRRSRIRGYRGALREAKFTPEEFDVAALLEEIDTLKEIASYQDPDNPDKINSYVIPIYQKKASKGDKAATLFTTEPKSILYFNKKGQPVYEDNKHYADMSVSEILDALARSRYDGVMSQPMDSQTLSDAPGAVSGIYRVPTSESNTQNLANKNALLDREMALDHSDVIATNEKGKPIFENGKIKTIPGHVQRAENAASRADVSSFVANLAMKILSSGQGNISLGKKNGIKYTNRDSYIKEARKKLLANKGRWSPEIDPNNEFAAFWPTTHEMHAGFIKARDENMEEVREVIKKALESTTYADYAPDIANVLSKAFMEQQAEEELELQKAEMDEFMKADEEFKDKVVSILENFNSRMLSLEKAVSESKSFSEPIDSEADKTHGTAKKAVTKGNHGSMADAHTTQNPIGGAKKEVNKFEKPTEKEKELIPTPGQKQTASQKDPHAGIPSLNKAVETPSFKEGVKAGEMQAIKKMAEAPEAVVSAKPQAIPETERMQVLQKSALPAVSDEELLNTKNIGRLLAKKAGN